jgi:hypothetical protein
MTRLLLNKTEMLIRLAANNIITFGDAGYGGCIVIGAISNLEVDFFTISICQSMKNGVFCHVKPCGSCKNRRFRGT